MKKIIIATVGLAFFFTSCLKDKGFDNNEYGIENPGGSPKGVGFPLAVNTINAFGLNAVSTINQEVGDIVVVNSETGELPTTDVKVVLAVDQSLVIAYNVANASNPDFVPLAVLRPSLYTLTNTVVTIPAGQPRGQIKINIPSTVAFALDSSYGLAFKIVSVDNGYTIAKNLSKLIISFNIKNKFDGKYKLDFSNYHPSSNPGYTGGSTNVELRTSGTNSVKIWFNAASAFANPSILSGGLNYFGNQEPEYTFLAATATSGTVTSVFNTIPAGPVYNINTSYANVYGIDPVSGKLVINVKWGYNNPGGVFNPASTREWTQKFTYIGPR